MLDGYRKGTRGWMAKAACVLLFYSNLHLRIYFHHWIYPVGAVHSLLAVWHATICYWASQMDTIWHAVLH